MADASTLSNGVGETQHVDGALDAMQTPWQVVKAESEQATGNSFGEHVLERIEPAFPREELKKHPGALPTRECPGKCGLAITWHATHCCPGCATTGRHGPGCEWQPFVTNGKEELPDSVSDDAQTEVGKKRSWSSRLFFHPLWQRVWMKPEDGVVQDLQTESHRMSESSHMAAEMGSTLKPAEDHDAKEKRTKPFEFVIEGDANTKPAATVEEQDHHIEECAKLLGFDVQDDGKTTPAATMKEQDHHAEEECAKQFGVDIEGGGKTEPAESVEEQEQTKAHPIFTGGTVGISEQRKEEHIEQKEEVCQKSEEQPIIPSVAVEKAYQPPENNVEQKQDHLKGEEPEVEKNCVAEAAIYTGITKDSKPDDEDEEGKMAPGSRELPAQAVEDAVEFPLISQVFATTRDEELDEAEIGLKVNSIDFALAVTSEEQCLSGAQHQNLLPGAYEMAENGSLHTETVYFDLAADESDGPSRDLLESFSIALQERNLEMKHVPNGELEQIEFFEELGFYSAVERAQLRKAMRDASADLQGATDTKVIATASEQKATPCVCGCGFVATWHGKLCCLQCAQGGKHGPWCDRKPWIQENCNAPRQPCDAGGAKHKNSRPCACGCGFMATWHDSICCTECAINGKHGPSCDQKPMIDPNCEVLGQSYDVGEEVDKEGRPCASGCGFMVTWHETHCCTRCGNEGKHGSRCDRKPWMKQKREALEQRRGDAYEEMVAHKTGRPCARGCGFMTTWHETHCCNGCANGDQHGHRCDRKPWMKQKPEALKQPPRAGEKGEGNKGGRQCAGRCGFMATWHETHCCNGCANGDKHGHRCDRKPWMKHKPATLEQPHRAGEKGEADKGGRPCVRGCGFMANWHETHCCKGCANGDKHGHRCDRKPWMKQKPEAFEQPPRAGEKGEVDKVGRPCARGCGFMATWHETHCCNGCSKRGKHGRHCERKLWLKPEYEAPRKSSEVDEPEAEATVDKHITSACAGACGFAVTWHATHCCVGCARGQKHGPRCRRKLI